MIFAGKQITVTVSHTGGKDEMVYQGSAYTVAVLPQCVVVYQNGTVLHTFALSSVHSVKEDSLMLV